LITNEFGGSDQIRAEFITNASDAGVYHHLGEEKAPKQDLNLIKDKLSSRSDWKKEGYKGIENLAPETLEILFNNLESTVGTQTETRSITSGARRPRPLRSGFY
jgi:hypothetical protein